MVARIFLVLLATAMTFAAGFAQGFSTVATLGQTFMGPIQGADSFTTVTVTNRDPNQVSCDVDIFFSQGTESGPPIIFNGQSVLGNFVTVTVPRGGARSFDLTADQLTQGIVNVFTFDPCDEDSISVKGSYTVPNAAGSITEVFSVTPNDSGQWLDDDQCLAFTVFRGVDAGGFDRDIGLAHATVNPGQAPPPGTTLNIMAFDSDGNPLVPAVAISIDGQHSAFFPFTGTGISGLITAVMCLDIPGTGSDFLLDTTLIGTAQKDGFQLEAEIFADGFESGDTSAWSSSNP